MACVSGLHAQTTPNLPTAPTAVDLPLSGGGNASTYAINIDTTGYVTHSVNPVTTTAELNQALLDAACGTNGYIINLSSTATFSKSTSFVLTDKACAAGKYIIIQSSNLGACPTDGNRIDPTYTGSIPKLVASTNTRIFTINDGQDNTILRCLEFTESVATAFTSLVTLGIAPTTEAGQAHNIILDHIYVTTDEMADSRRGINIAASNVAIINSYIENIHDDAQDAQAIAVPCSSGQILIDNNYIEASTENFMSAGTTCGLPSDLLPDDITFTRNHLDKDRGWEDVYLVKNTFESKGGRRWLVKGNLMSENWAGSQDAMVNIKSVNTDGDDNWIEYSDYEFSYNWFRNSDSGWFKSAAHPETPNAGVGFGGRLYVHDNLVTGMGGEEGFLIAVFDGGNGTVQGHADVYFNHNTILATAATVRVLSFNPFTLSAGETPLTRFGFHNSIMAANATNANGINEQCTVGGSGVSCVTTADFFNNYLFDNGTGTVNCSNDWGANATVCDTTDANIAGVGFVDSGNGDYRLSAMSDGKAAALDGDDIGITVAGYTLMACLTGIAESGINANCSTASPPQTPGPVQTQGPLQTPGPLQVAF